MYYYKIIIFWLLFSSLLFSKNRHLGSVIDIELSHDKKFYMSAGEDGKIYFCNTEHHEVIKTINFDKNNMISNMTISYDNTFLAASFNDYSIQIFNLKNNSHETIYLKNHSNIMLLNFIERGQLLCATKDGYVFLWNIDSNNYTFELVNHFKSSKSKIIDTKINSNKRNILSRLNNNQFARWDIGQTKQIMFFENNNEYTSNFRISGGDRTSYTENDYPIELFFTKETKLIDVPSRNFLFNIPYKYYDFDISTDGSKIAIITNDNQIFIWNSNFSDQNLFIDGHNQKILDLEFSNYGKKLATSSIDKSIKIWATSSGELLDTISIFKDWATKVIFSNDILIYGTYSGDINFYLLSNNN